MPGETPIDELVSVMHRLRTECPWHAEQTHETLVTYLIEECFELVEAIEVGTADAIREEAGDLLYQVIFHCELLAERADPDNIARDNIARDNTELYSIATRLSEKLKRRHPHVFANAGPTTVAELDASWEQVKQMATDARPRAVLEGVPFTMPALALADKVLDRAQRHGLDLTIAPVQHPSTEAEFGQALIALVADARFQGVDAERALRAALRELAAKCETR